MALQELNQNTCSRSYAGTWRIQLYELLSVLWLGTAANVPALRDSRASTPVVVSEGRLTGGD